MPDSIASLQTGSDAECRHVRDRRCPLREGFDCLTLHPRGKVHVDAEGNESQDERHHQGELRPNLQFREHSHCLWTVGINRPSTYFHLMQKSYSTFAVSSYRPN